MREFGADAYNSRTIFAERLRALREDAKLTQAQLGDKLGVSRGSISYYENMDRVPDIEFLVKVTDFFDVSIDYMLGKSNSKEAIRDIGYTLGLSEWAVSRLQDLSGDDNTIALLIFDCMLSNYDFTRLLGLVEKYIAQCVETELAMCKEDYDAIRKGGKSLYERLQRLEKQDNVKKAVRKSFGGDAVVVSGTDASDLTLFQASKLFLKIVDECRDDVSFYLQDGEEGEF